VPIREIALTEAAGEPPLPVYDPSGPYTDPDVVIDVEKGLGRKRTAWVLERGGVEEYEGRNVMPEDNGNVSGKHQAREYAIVNRPLRGLDGKPGHITRNGEELDEGVLTLLPGEWANLETPGGGGFGSPADREVEAVLDDVRQGYVSSVEAAKAYGDALELSQAPVPVAGAASLSTSERGDDPS